MANLGAGPDISSLLFITLCVQSIRGSTVPGSLENRGWNPDIWFQVHSSLDITLVPPGLRLEREPWAFHRAKPKPAGQNSSVSFILS